MCSVPIVPVILFSVENIYLGYIIYLVCIHIHTIKDSNSNLFSLP